MIALRLKNESRAQSARQYNPSKCYMFPIALHISDSTLHILQCPSRLLSFGQRKQLRQHCLSPSAAHGFFEGILISIAPLSLSDFYQTLLSYHTHRRKSSVFGEKGRIFLHFQERYPRKAPMLYT